MNIKTNIKKVNFSFIVFFLLTIFMTFTFIYTIKIDIETKNNYSVIKNVEAFNLINKELDTIFIKQTGHISLEQIALLKRKTTSVAKELDNLGINQLKSKNMTENYQQIKDGFEQKFKITDKFILTNKSLSDSISSLFELQILIQTRYYFTQMSYDANNIAILFSQILLYDAKVEDDIKKNLTSLQNQIEGFKLIDPQLLKYVNITKDLLTQIEQISKLMSNSRDILLEQKIINFRNSLVLYFEQSQRVSKNISYLLYAISFILFIALVIAYLKEKSNKLLLLKLQKAIENSDDSIVMTDLNKNIVYVNKAFEKISGYCAKEALGQNPRFLKSGIMGQEHYDALNKTIDMGQNWEGDFINKRKDGSIYYEKATITPIIFEDKIEGFLAIKLDITNFIEAKKQIEHIAYHDKLTDLPNRLKFEELATKAMDNARKLNKKISFFLIDLDRFKLINDTLGHQNGDQMLKILALRLQDLLNSQNITSAISRFGGDEFMILVENIEKKEDVWLIGSKILKAIKEPVQINDYLLDTSASIGITIFPDDADTLEELMKNVDSAMYLAKDSGKNNFKFFVASIADKIQKRTKIENKLKTALENNEFYLVYQPQYDLKTKKVVGAEALIRWENEELGFVPPSDFIPIAEEGDYISKIGIWVFEEAVREFAKWQKYFFGIDTIAINVSSVQFKDLKIDQKFAKILENTNIPASNVEIEITERYLMESSVGNIKILDILKNQGFKFSVDDFGTGYSSMGYLKSFPLNTIKIDKSFVDGVAQNENDAQITKAIVALSHSLKYANVAEGIESCEQEDFLISIDCDIGQGYYFSKPLKSQDFIDFMNKKLKISS